MQLRYYQQQAIDNLRNAYRFGCQAPLLCLPTGAGKTVVFSAIARQAVAKGRQVLILVHRRELIQQSSDKLTLAGVKHGVIAAGFPETEASVQVASVQTLARRLKSIKWSPCLIIIDECHHATAGSWDKVLNHWSSALRLGVTATPCRLDGRGLGRVFDQLILGPTIDDLIYLGFLSRYRVFAPPVVADLSGIRKRGGDYDLKDVEERLCAPTVTGDAVRQYKLYGKNQQAIAFAVTVFHAKLIAEEFCNASIPAETITGEMPIADRDAVVQRFANGQTKIMVSVNVVSEGFDCPKAACAILLRPTASESLYLQQVGRVLRPSEGKDHAIIIDHVGNVPRHGLPCQHRDWSLADRPKKQSAALIAVKQCPECFAVFHPQRFCPECGVDLRQDKAPARPVDSDLIEIKPLDVDPTGKPVIVNFGPHAPAQTGYFIDSVCSDGHFMIRLGDSWPFKVNRAKVRIDRDRIVESKTDRRALKQEQANAHTLPQLLALANERGYSPGWAYKIHQARGQR